MHRLLLAILLLLATADAPALAQGGQAYRAPQPPRGAAVAVYRGNVRQGTSPVMIYRGSAVAPARPVRVSAASLARTVPVAGSRLWLVDRERDRLVACRLARSAAAGDRRAIRCSERRLELD